MGTGLPEESPDVALVWDVLNCAGKGHGVQSFGKLFVTPPSKQSGYGGEEEGRVPGDRHVGELGNRDEPGAPMEDSFQQALEVEIVQHLRDVQHLREQNAQLTPELERLRMVKSSSGSGEGPTPAQSWAEVPNESLHDGRGGRGEGRTPRNGAKCGKGCRYTKWHCMGCEVALHLGMNHLSRALQFYLLCLLFQLLGMTWLLECWTGMKLCMMVPRFEWVTGRGKLRVQVLMSLDRVKLELFGWSVKWLH